MSRLRLKASAGKQVSGVGKAELQMSVKAFFEDGEVEPGEILVFRQDLQDIQDFNFTFSVSRFTAP